MELKQFKEYKAVIEEAIRQADLAENVTIQQSTLADSRTILLSTTRARDCVLFIDGIEIQVMKRVRHASVGTTSYKTVEVVNLAEPGSILQLGVAIKDLLNFSYWSRTDDLG